MVKNTTKLTRLFCGLTRKMTTGVILLAITSLVNASPNHRCGDEAKKQAKKLLAFHFGSEERIEIENNVQTLLSIRNPADKKQSFDVLEVWGTIYKGQYRMRLIYAQIPRECVLMGQEILEYARL